MQGACIKEYGSTQEVRQNFLSRDGTGSKWPLVLILNFLARASQANIAVILGQFSLSLPNPFPGNITYLPPLLAIEPMVLFSCATVRYEISTWLRVRVHVQPLLSFPLPTQDIVDLFNGCAVSSSQLMVGNQTCLFSPATDANSDSCHVLICTGLADPMLAARLLGYKTGSGIATAAQSVQRYATT